MGGGKFGMSIRRAKAGHHQIYESKTFVVDESQEIQHSINERRRSQLSIERPKIRARRFSTPPRRDKSSQLDIEQLKV